MTRVLFNLRTGIKLRINQAIFLTLQMMILSSVFLARFQVPSVHWFAERTAIPMREDGNRSRGHVIRDKLMQTGTVCQPFTNLMNLTLIVHKKSWRSRFTRSCLMILVQKSTKSDFQVAHHRGLSKPA